MPTSSASAKSAFDTAPSVTDALEPSDIVPPENTFGRWKIGRASFRHTPSSWRNKSGKNKDGGEADDAGDEISEADQKKIQRSHSHSEVPAVHQQSKQMKREGSFFKRTMNQLKKQDSLKSPDQVVELKEPKNQPPAGQFSRVSLTPADRVVPAQQRVCDGNEKDAEPEVTFKVMLIGDSGVGKTCLLVQFKDGKFLAGNFIATVGMDFRNKNICVDGTKVKLQIWDTAGQERFRSVTHAYYRDANALLLLYDVTNRKTFANTRAWLMEIRENASNNVVIFLVGNKCDCSGRREVSKEEGETLASECNIAFAETSAMTGINVGIVFDAVARELLHRWRDNSDGRRTTFDMNAYVTAELDKNTKGSEGWKCFCR